MPDFTNYVPGRTDPGLVSFEITDDVAIDPPARAVHANGTGTVSGFLAHDDTTGTARDFAVVAGAEYALQFKLVTAGADLIVGLR